MKLSNRVILLGEYIHRVYRYISIDKLELGNAYIFGTKKKSNIQLCITYVFPFRGKYTKDATEPGIYLTDKDAIYTIFPETKEDKLQYNINRIIEITPDNINNSLDSCLKDIDPSQLKHSTNVFVPKISIHDDIGMKALRLALAKKEIDINAYKTRFDKPHDISNAMKALKYDPRITVAKLTNYCQVFDLDYGIMIFDKKGAQHPMYNDGSAMLIFNDGEFDIKNRKVHVINSLDDVIGKKVDNTKEDEDFIF